MKYIEGLSVGHDAEVFLKQGDKYVSAIGKVGGSKTQPRPVKLGALQEDNVLAEMNIVPAYTKADFINNSRAVMDALKDIVSPYHIDIRSSANFIYEDLVAAGPAAFRLGCDPDYNIYTGEVNVAPVSETTLRTAAGHVHVGFEEGKYSIQSLVKVFDIAYGIPSVLLDEDVQRRQMYGKAGCFRPKPYGVEYRTLGNFWLKSNELMGWVFDTAHNSINMLEHLEEFHAQVSEKEVQFIINTSNKTLAEKAVKSLGLRLP